MTATTGRRERKKAQTRQALSDAALRLCLERGFDDVGVREIAEAADVSLSTLFKHFPSKEALLFDRDEDLEAALVAAVRDRPAGRSIIHALRDHLLAMHAWRGDSPQTRAFQQLVSSTPALREYFQRMWLRHETTLAAAIAEATDAPADDLTAASLAHFVLECRTIVANREDPRQALRELFALFEHGWGEAVGR